MIFIHLWHFIGGNLDIKVTCKYVMLVMTRNMVHLKDEILTKIDDKFNDFENTVISEFREQIKQIFRNFGKRTSGKGRTGIDCLYASETCRKLSDVSESVEGQSRRIRTVR